MRRESAIFHPDRTSVNDAVFTGNTHRSESVALVGIRLFGVFNTILFEYINLDINVTHDTVKYFSYWSYSALYAYEDKEM